jgi:hypothetical protein
MCTEEPLKTLPTHRDMSMFMTILMVIATRLNMLSEVQLLAWGVRESIDGLRLIATYSFTAEL